ncbi:type I restriction endonuclease subunit R [Deinococcus aquaedulcis]|uniref:type I restriction endonuclease subunit R n=1 Tax=Deinococcus aquaedulcis TaxID=2840455 RepID=UPI001C82B57A|nr:type I restriction endonuclease [Deinococcus aquaedulcis]
MDTTEKAFETLIEEQLLASGYAKRLPKDFVQPLQLDLELLVTFIKETQPQEWQKLDTQYAPDTMQKVGERVHAAITKSGLLSVLRKGVKDRGVTLRLAFFKPANSKNPHHQQLYQRNRFSVVRQLRYSATSGDALDLTLFLNGLPLATAELKNPHTGQTVEHAMLQYRTDRSPKEDLFRRTLVHFAVDPDLVYMTTHLAGEATFFLPFNRGVNYGAGNPVNPHGPKTAYLWEQIWQPDSWLDLLQNFLYVDGESQKVLFPRYHQLTVVRELLDDAQARGAGYSYLIEHSAGSGKSNSIAWLAHGLSSLHNAEDEKVFDSVLVITDRRILDRQLRETVQQFQQVRGVVEAIDQNAAQLAAALNEGRPIIVTTLQKFPYALEKLRELGLAGKRFAVIVDEAHSSQTGESTKALKSALGSGAGPDMADTEDEAEQPDVAERIQQDIEARGRQANLSYFAFTATPKPKTLRLFGRQRSDGGFEAHSLYPMRQAIEEKFIMDVLANYTTYKVYFALHKRLEDDPEYNTRAAVRALTAYADLHEHAFKKKTEIMLDHFQHHTQAKIGGKAKAMLVTSSRLHAVRYKKMFDQLIQDRELPFKVLVAFSGTVTDGGIDHTEFSMNGDLPETRTAEEFKKPEYRILIAANKFQTGFSQSLLHTMYVDKLLSSVAAVQTLSRLNRIHPGKDDTMVLDFANQAEDIKKAFTPYYETTILSGDTDPNLLYDLLSHLQDAGIYDTDTLEAFKTVFYSDASVAKLHPVLDQVTQEFRLLPLEEQVNFKARTRDYLRLYAFLSQVITFKDEDLEVSYSFLRLLLPKLPKLKDDTLPHDLLERVDMESYRVQRKNEEAIKLQGGEPFKPIAPGDGQGLTEDEKEQLSKIIHSLNDRFGTDFTPEDRVTIQQVMDSLIADPELVESVRVNSEDNARLVHDELLEEKFQDVITRSFDLYKRFVDDEKFNRHVKEAVFGLVYAQILKGEPSPAGPEPR